VIRFASFIKVEDSIGDIIKQWAIDGSKLFDAEYLSANLDCIITDRNYFPLYKLFYVVNAILQLTEEKDPNPRKDELECKMLDESPLDIAEDAILGLKAELEKLNNMSVIDLGSGQLARMLRSIHMTEESESVKKWAVDGFSLVCILGNEADGQTLRNYFSEEDVKLLIRLSQLFLHLYYTQFAQLAQETTTLTDMNLDDLGIEINDIQFDQNRSFHSSQYGISEEGDFKADEETEIVGNAMRTSDYGVSERGSVAVSDYEVSMRGSVRGSVGISEVGSVRGSTRDSVYASSEVMDDEPLQASNKK
jgi:hypothetical protein